jgi:adenine-specific DNA glycosylase
LSIHTSELSQCRTKLPRFPTIEDLVCSFFNFSLFTFKSKSVSQAASDIEQVNALWKGLGYYSRASRLLAGAQKVVKTLTGRLPDDAKEMQDKVPGIGRYSAGAICSIAYGERVPVVSDAFLFLAIHRH